MNHIAKTNISRVMMLFCFPIWLWQEALCVDRRAASRRVSLLRLLINYFYMVSMADRQIVFHEQQEEEC